MKKVKRNEDIQENEKRKPCPAITPEGRESQLIALAVDLAEQQLLDGTASSQVITHYLKLGSTRERIEKEILEKQKCLIEAKTESIKDNKRNSELFEEALKAFRGYQMPDDDSGSDDYDSTY